LNKGLTAIGMALKKYLTDRNVPNAQFSIKKQLATIFILDVSLLFGLDCGLLNTPHM
jgi:hypothetical protein